jgi:hypothetical protein
MSLLTDLPAAALDFVIAFLLPLILPRNGGDTLAARTLALQMLEDHHPQTVRELRLAGEAVGFSLKSLTMLAESAEPNIAAEKLESSMKWACGLSRSGHLAQRRLDELQRLRKTGCRPEEIPNATQLQTAILEAAPEGAPATVEPTGPPNVAQAEAALRSAEKLLALMKMHHKGAPPPHSQAAQQIQAQHRLVDTARMKLQQARRREAETASPPEPASIAA